MMCWIYGSPSLAHSGTMMDGPLCQSLQLMMGSKKLPLTYQDMRIVESVVYSIISLMYTV